MLRETYEDLEDLANYLEMVDTRDHTNIWLEDGDGEHWDIKLDVLNGDIEDTQYFHLPGPKMIL